MENFITGYPGHEHQHRAAMLQVLGQEKYDFFFDKWLEHFFTDADAKFFASLGLNCLRIPFNYHHFEDDMNPRVLKKEGFKHLDRVVELVSTPVTMSDGLKLGSYELLKKENSAQSIEFTQFWTSMLFRAGKTRIGITS
jgi:aryl-phospho-beta-D-glucosidase BglC (GH1 family)